MAHLRMTIDSENKELNYLESILSNHPLVGRDFFSYVKTASPSLRKRCLDWLRRVFESKAKVFVSEIYENEGKPDQGLPRKVRVLRMSRESRKDKRIVSPYDAKGYMKRVRSARKGKALRRVVPSSEL